MWTRTLLKNRAKYVLFKRNTYGKDILCLLILMGIGFAAGFTIFLLGLIVGLASGITHTFMFLTNNGFTLTPGNLILNGFFRAVSLAVMVFVTFPLIVGVVRFFLNGRQKAPDYSDIFRFFGSGKYFKAIGALLWRYLFTLLWSAPYLICLFAVRHLKDMPLSFYPQFGLILFFSLLMIPSLILLIYKQISYLMTAYILSDNPNIGYRRALRLSIEMTSGQIGRIFVFGLSFLGWILLGAVACGVGLLFVFPYVQAGFAELYAELRDRALKAGVCTYAELNFLEPAPGKDPVNG